MNYGFIPSKMDGTELEFEKVQGMKLPESYTFIKYLPKILNQGSKPICVPCSISSYINWKINLESGKNKTDNNVDLMEIYNSKTTSNDNGMSFKEALHFLRHKGVKTDKGKEKIERYAKVGSVESLKQAIILNGPCVGALPVYDSLRDDFWTETGDYQGGHAVALIGYDKEGIIIRNSWGESYGENGYYKIPYEEFNEFMEIWTIC